MAFHNKLYKLRKQKGFSQEELANRLNVSRQTVSKWELGETTPDMERLMALSELFGISIDELVFHKAEDKTDTTTIPNNETTSSASNTQEITMAEVLDSKILTSSNKKKVTHILKIVKIEKKF